MLTLSEYLSLDDPNLKLENQDAVLIILPDILANTRDSKIEEYLYNGGHLIITSGINSKPSDYSIINSLVPDIDGEYKNTAFRELSGVSFQDIDLSSIQTTEIYNLFLSASGQDRNIRLFKYISLPYNPKKSQMRLENGSTIWNRYSINNGIIDIFGFFRFF